MSIEQQAGNCRIGAETGGHPVWVNVEVISINGQASKARVRVNDLHDLRYCIDRVLAQLPERAS